MYRSLILILASILFFFKFAVVNGDYKKGVGFLV